MTAINALALNAAPRTDPRLVKIGRTAEECQDKLERGESTVACYAVIERNLNGSGKKAKAAAIELLLDRLQKKNSDPRGKVYLDDIRDDLLARINGRLTGKEGVRLVRYADVLARALLCVDSRYGNLDLWKCTSYIKSPPLDLSIASQLHAIRLIEAEARRFVVAPEGVKGLFLFRCLMVTNLIGDSI